jgi:type II secretory pathway pseudopilin PulG
VLLVVISISLYFTITSIQNYMQAQKNFEQTQKDANLAMRQLEDEVEETQREVEH